MCQQTYLCIKISFIQLPIWEILEPYYNFFLIVTLRIRILNDSAITQNITNIMGNIKVIIN